MTGSRGKKITCLCPDCEAGRHMFLIQILGWDDTHSQPELTLTFNPDLGTPLQSWPHLLLNAYIKTMEGGRLALRLLAVSCQHIHWRLFRIPAYTHYQPRCPACGMEQLLDSWAFHSQLAQQDCSLWIIPINSLYVYRVVP